MTFAQRATEILRQKGISNNELARKARLSSSGISTALRDGGNPRESTMQSIYDALDMSPEEFWTGHRFIDSLDPEQEQLLAFYDQLNITGKKAVFSLAEKFSQDPDYRQDGYIPLAE